MNITSHRFSHSKRGFTLLEMVIVLGITAMLLTAMYSISQGTITLADDIEKHQRRERRQYSYLDFCRHLLSNLPATAIMNLKTTQDGSSYLSTLEFQNVRSPFDGAPQQIVTMKTDTVAGGGIRLILTSQRMPDPQAQALPGANKNPLTQVVLLENLAQYEWRAFDTISGQWTSTWREEIPNLMTAPPTPPAGAVTGNVNAGTGVAGGVTAGTVNAGNTNAGNVAAVPAQGAAIRSMHPLMLELTMAAGIDPPRRWVFWIPPSEQPAR
ncbi:type II secretion system protein J [Prosthecobacter sp.]|uniref:type II secretion system protein J n=1 Tax=Prosthecobacter sp. TaxID=1965333 RepID=UPI003783E1CF